MRRTLFHLRHPEHTRRTRLERASPVAGAWLALTTWEMWKHFWVIPNPTVNLYVGASLLSIAAPFFFYSIIGELQDVFCEKRYIFDFSPCFNSFLLGYAVIFAAMDFAFALTTGGSIW